jgi:hypothetical protein
MRRIIAVFAIVAGTLLGAASAQAATNQTEYNGICETGELCLYYSAGLQGSMIDIVNPNIGGKVFLTPGAGQGHPVQEASSARNTSQSSTAWLYYSSNYAGPTCVINPNAAVSSLRSLLGQVGSIRWTF